MGFVVNDCAAARVPNVADAEVMAEFNVIMYNELQPLIEKYICMGLLFCLLINTFKC